MLGGYAAGKFGGKVSLIFSIGSLSVTSLLIPEAARFDYRYVKWKEHNGRVMMISSFRLVIAIRVFQGLVSGIGFPSIYQLFGVWSPPGERATLMSMVFSGIPFASIANFPMSSLLCKTGIDGGWPMVFYVPGK
jgi:MFS family permease